MSGRYPPRSRRSLMRGLAGLGLAAGVWPLAGCGRGEPVGPSTGAARAGKPPDRIYRIGVLASSTAQANEPIMAQFRQGLAERGWVEGHNLAFESRYSEGDFRRAAPNVAELLDAGVDVIVTFGTAEPVVAKRATATTPIVFAGSVADPVGNGFAQSLDRPGGNITGIATPPGEFFTGKQLEVFKDAVPTLGRVGILWDTSFQGAWRPAGAGAPAPAARGAEIAVRHFEETARDLGVAVKPMEVRDASGLADAFAAAGAARIDGVYVWPSPMFTENAMQILDLAARYRLPLSSVEWQYWRGALLSYTVDNPALGREAAGYVDRILRGARPGDLPIERPKKYLLIINLKTAAALGLTIPPAVLARATEVIQ
jgi:putative ABC transport system substrate-binding protein